jgi:hypothetical protein
LGGMSALSWVEKSARERLQYCNRTLCAR